MLFWFRAVALDYDGTIAVDDVPDPHVLTAVHELRRRGRRVVLCTGRILSELKQVFPDVAQHFDAIVAENGAVIALPGRGERALGEGLPAGLMHALQRRRIPVRTGTVLLATKAAYSREVLEQVEALGLDAQLLRNRAELMVLPSGITKATGLLHALGELEVSRHSTIAFGDAENDIALLQACEIGVAVGDAVASLRQHADVVLEEPNGAGIAGFLLGPVLSGEVLARPERWTVELGSTDDGTSVRLPASRLNVLIAGGSCAGKSYIGGALIERLSALGYSVCVFDAEGDHASISALRGVVAVGGPEPLPPPPQIARLIRNRFSSIIVDMSLLPYDQKQAYVRATMHELVALRRASGLPHWIVFEEADQLLWTQELPAEEPHLRGSGFCLVSHRPGALPAGVLQNIDAVIAVPGAERYAAGAVAEATGEISEDGVERPFALAPGEALLSFDGRLTRFRAAERASTHVRHQHKYIHAQVPPDRRFFFATGTGAPAVGNLVEFCRAVQGVGEAVLRQHLQAGDFSRWVREVLADDELGARLRSIERWYRNEHGLDVEQVREALVAEIEGRYGADALAGVHR